jgi:hypothetical protein
MNESEAAADYAVAGEHRLKARLKRVDLGVSCGGEENGGQKPAREDGRCKAFSMGP